MTQDLPVLDMQFGVSQLSGNRQLLIKLLNKFREENEETVERLQQALQQQDLSTSKSIVHTLKGVAGNLGMRVLHQNCKRLEEAILHQQDTHSLFVVFAESVEMTFEKIKAESAASSPEFLAQPEKAENGQVALITKLKQNEYIPPDELERLLSGLTLEPCLIEKLRESINDLDYPIALNILESL